MDKILSVYSHGVCLFSVNVLQDFLKREKIKRKNIAYFFQKDKDRYLTSQKEGVWIPLVGINSGEYVIKVEGFDVPFDNEWEQKLEYEGFNLELRDGLWISDMETLYEFEPSEFCGTEVSYISGDGDLLYRNFRYDIPNGKYLVKIKGYLRKQILKFPNPNYGYMFSLTKVDKFDGYKNPREKDEYDFNVGKIN